MPAQLLRNNIKYQTCTSARSYLGSVGDSILLGVEIHVRRGVSVIPFSTAAATTISMVVIARSAITPSSIDIDQ